MAMRVSEASIYNRISRQTRTARNRLANASEPLMTGQKINRPSDDPQQANRIAGNQRTQSELELFRGNISRLNLYHQVVETSVTQVVEDLSDLSTLAMSMANDTMDADARKLASEEVSALIDSMKGLANAKFNGRHIFAGRKQDQPPYDAAGTFVGDATGRVVAVGENMEVKGDLTGPTVFGQPGSSAFEAAEELKAALLANDGDAIAAAMTKIDAAHKTATSALVRVGYAMNHLHNVDVHHEETLFTHKIQRASLEEVDISKAASEMAFAEHVYQTAIQTASQLNRILDMETKL